MLGTKKRDLRPGAGKGGMLFGAFFFVATDFLWFVRAFLVFPGAPKIDAPFCGPE